MHPKTPFPRTQYPNSPPFQKYKIPVCCRFGAFCITPTILMSTLSNCICLKPQKTCRPYRHTPISQNPFPNNPIPQLPPSQKYKILVCCRFRAFCSTPTILMSTLSSCICPKTPQKSRPHRHTPIYQNTNPNNQIPHLPPSQKY